MQTHEIEKIRPTIGSSLDWVGGRSQSHVWSGALAAVEEHDANLVIFSSRSLRAPHQYLSQSNSLFAAIGGEDLDGVVILSGAFSNYLSQDEFRKFIHHFQPLPIISISFELAGIPSVLIGNQTGMRAVVAYFIETHRHRRTAFVCGPEVNDETQERYATYRDELAQHNIPFDPILVAPGNFSEATRIKAASTLLDKRHFQPEAIAAVDDDNALGVLSALEPRGLNVSKYIATSGFDDIHESRYSLPPLTTVVQPFYQRAHLAISLILGYLSGKPIPPSIQLPMNVIIRESCGFIMETAQIAGRIVESTRGSSKNGILLTPILSAVQETIQQNCLPKNNPGNIPSLATQLVASFVADLNHGNTNKFIMILGQILCLAVVQHPEIGKWQNVRSFIRTAMITHWPDPVRSFRAEGLRGQARLNIGSYLEEAAASGSIERLKSDTRRIQETAQKMERLLNVLLELSRIERIVNPHPSGRSFLVPTTDVIYATFGL